MAKSSKKNTTAPIKIQFHRWLVPALLMITLYLITVLVFAVYGQYGGDRSIAIEVLISIIFILAIAAGVWWLIESARWIMIHINVRAARKAAPAKKRSAKKK